MDSSSKIIVKKRERGKNISLDLFFYNKTEIRLPRGTPNPALVTSSGIEIGSFETTSCLGMQTLPTDAEIT